jgi:hypothetical protein
MRMAALTLVSALGLAVSAVSASATPVAPAQPTVHASNVLEIAGGCGWNFHPNRWGRCVPNRYGYYPPRPYWQPYWPGYYGGGYEPWNRPSPTDHVANQLNRQARVYGY